MEENKELNELLSVLRDVYGWNDTNELTQVQKELVNDTMCAVKILNKHNVSGSLPLTISQGVQICSRWEQHLLSTDNKDIGHIPTQTEIVKVVLGNDR